MKESRCELGFTNGFSAVHSPWVNSGAQTTNRRVWASLDVIMNQNALLDLVKALNFVEYYINNTTNPRRANFTPNELFCGIKHGERTSIEGRLANELNDKNQKLNNFSRKVQPGSELNYEDHFEVIKKVFHEMSFKSFH